MEVLGEGEAVLHGTVHMVRQTLLRSHCSRTSSSWAVFLFSLFPFLSLVPFDEDDKDDSVWFLDHDYLENMYGMFKKVNGKSEF